MGEKAELFRAFMELYQRGERDLACRTYLHPDLEMYEPPSLPHGGSRRRKTAHSKPRSVNPSSSKPR